MTLRGQSAIVGLGEFKPKIYSDGATTLTMLAQVGMQAVADAGLEPSDIDGLVTELFSEAPFMGACVVSEYLGLRPSFLEQVDLGGATSGVMVARAAAAIAAGQCETVLVVTAARRERRVVNLPPRTGSYKDRTPAGEFDVPYGATGSWAFAMFADAYLSASDVTTEHLAKIAIAARNNGCRNPNAIHYGHPLKLEEYLSSPITADPLRVLDGAISCAGASALVITTAEKAAALSHRPVYILGTGEHHTHNGPASAPEFRETGLRRAADRAFAMSGLRRSDMDFVCIYDAFTTLVPSSLEQAGFVEGGTAGRFLDEHNIEIDGDFPVNPHGGQLAFGHTGVPAGMSLITATARQIMGRADGHQVKHHRFAFVNGCGGEMATHVGLVLGGDLG